jgi:hypothetical protein
MSRRTLGGGRILGSSATLSPPPQPHQLSKSNSHLLPPSPSNLSIDSAVSTPRSSESHDLAPKSFLEHGDSPAANVATAASSRLVCPICNEEMVRCSIEKACFFLLILVEGYLTSVEPVRLSLRQYVDLLIYGSLDTWTTYIKTSRTSVRMRLKIGSRAS